MSRRGHWLGCECNELRRRSPRRIYLSVLYGVRSFAFALDDKRFALDDKASFIIYNPQKEKFVTFKDVAQRQDKETVLQLPKRFAGDTVHAWMQYTNATGDMVSTSVYLREITIL